MTPHVAVFIDHNEARILHVDKKAFDETTLHAPHHVFRHPKGQTGHKPHPEEEHKFFQDLAKALEGATEVLVLGPSTEKLHLMKYAHEHDHALLARIVGIETVDHPTDKQLAAYVRNYFLSPKSSHEPVV